jgi:hypothetical protein
LPPDLSVELFLRQQATPLKVLSLGDSGIVSPLGSFGRCKASLDDSGRLLLGSGKLLLGGSG